MAGSFFGVSGPQLWAGHTVKWLWLVFSWMSIPEFIVEAEIA
jgi:hypothetical protein